MNIVPLQLKINKFLCEINELKNNITLMFIQSNDRELLKKCREIWNKIIE